MRREMRDKGYGMRDTGFEIVDTGYWIWDGRVLAINHNCFAKVSDEMITRHSEMIFLDHGIITLLNRLPTILFNSPSN